jgi:hypothetical protein
LTVVVVVGAVVLPMPSLEEYTKDYESVLATINAGTVKSLSYARLKMLESKYEFHTLLNKERERDASIVCLLVVVVVVVRLFVVDNDRHPCVARPSRLYQYYQGRQSHSFGSCHDCSPLVAFHQAQSSAGGRCMYCTSLIVHAMILDCSQRVRVCVVVRVVVCYGTGGCQEDCRWHIGVSVAAVLALGP